jgi:tetratricopeptide (TPR) repeat protein
VTLVDLRQFDRALKDYAESIRLDPSSGLYLKNRATVFRITKKYAEGIADYRKALTMKIDAALKKEIKTALRELGLPA